jgi:hypothetical protein
MNHALPVYKIAIKGVKTSAVLEKYAAQDSSVLNLKSEHDFNLFQLLKNAGLQEIAGKIPESVRKGLGYGAGAAIPAAAAGGLLIHQAGNEARDTTEDLRNKALQTALGVGAIGAGLYGLHRATTPDHQKESSANDELLSKLATAGYLDVIFEAEEKAADDQDVRRKLSQCRLLNAEHGIQLFHELLT